MINIGLHQTLTIHKWICPNLLVVSLETPDGSQSVITCSSDVISRLTCDPYKLGYTLFGSYFHSCQDSRENNTQWEVGSGRTMLNYKSILSLSFHKPGPQYRAICGSVWALLITIVFVTKLVPTITSLHDLTI